MRRLLIFIGILAIAVGGQTQTTPRYAVMDSKGNLGASINTQINVMMYGAKGDCSTDDHNAIVAAQTAAEAFATAQSGPAGIYFPKPAGGCYLTSTVAWHGVSFIGQSTGMGDLAENKWTVNLRGLPGQDILQVPDPSTVSSSYPWFHSWSIENITFQVDGGGTAPNYPHRWPGRWSDEISTTNGSTVITSTSNQFSPADVGQAIQINGAGAGGANLVTTIASVTPAWSQGSTWQVVNIATPALTSVTNAHSYVSLLGLPVTTNIGNCAIAAPNLDAKISNWIVPTQDATSNNDVMRNVTFTNVHSIGTTTCGMFTQGLTTPYQFDVRNVNFSGLIFGVVQGTAELNSNQAASGNDFQVWDHVWMFGNKYPWISYNGGHNRLTNWQMSSQSGIQILGQENVTFDCACDWTFNWGSFEIPTGTTGYGTRIEGSVMRLHGSLGASGSTSWLGGSSFTGEIGSGFGTVNLVGQNINVTSDWDNMTVNDLGRGNSVTTTHNTASNWSGLQYPYPRSYFPHKGESQVSGRITSNFIRDGNYSTPYNWDDLLIWPQDFLVSVGVLPMSSLYTQDASSISGAEFILSQSILPMQYAQFATIGGTNGHLLVGTNIPAGKVQVYYSAKCLVGTGTFTLNIKTSTNAIPAQDTENCSTTLQTFHFTADLSSVSGQFIGFIPNTSTNILLSWIAFRPYVADVNGKSIPGAGATIATGPASSVQHNCPWFTDTIGTIGDSGNPCGASGAPTYYNVVTQSSFDNTGTTLEGAATATLLTTQPTLFFPAGTYNVNDGINLACTSSTCSGYRIIGAGRDKTILKATSCTNGYVLWYNNTTNSGDNFKGMRLEHLTLDVSSAGASCADVVRYTQTALTVMDDVAINGAGTSSGAVYSTGTIGISGSTVTGSGTTFTAAMVPGIIQVAGVMAEVGTFTDATHLQLVEPAFPTGTVTGGTSYALTYGGRAITCDPGNSYSQYGSFHDVFIQNVRFAYYSIGVTSGGCSRFTIDGKAGWLGWSGSRGTNTVAIFLGSHSDTWEIHAPINNFARGVLATSAHANSFISMDIENNSTYSPVSTCNGGVAAQQCIFGFEISASANSTGYGNDWLSTYVYLAGTAWVFDNAAGSRNGYIDGLRDDTFSNTNNFSFSGSTGCPANGSGLSIEIHTRDCNHAVVAQTVN